MDNQYYVYIMTNKYNTVLYTGITNDLAKRIREHKDRNHKGFTYKYNIDKLVYFEICSDVITAITREKQIKTGSRKGKNDLITAFNPEWKDVFFDLF